MSIIQHDQSLKTALRIATLVLNSGKKKLETRRTKPHEQPTKSAILSSVCVAKYVLTNDNDDESLYTGRRWC